jgi:hypothetical protein
METLPQELSRTALQSRPDGSPEPSYPAVFRGMVLQLLAISLLLLLGAGCVGTEAFLGPAEPTPPTGAPHQVVVTWDNHVILAADPVNGGEKKPGIAGRLYLFGPRIDFPMACEGSVIVDLYDEGNVGPDGAPRMLEEWRIDPVTMKKLLRQDMIGWGYTLYLPWGTYRPDITQIRLKLRFDPVKGSSLFAENSPMVIHHDLPPGPPGMNLGSRTTPGNPGPVRQASVVQPMKPNTP